MKSVTTELLLAGAGVGERHAACRLGTFQATTSAMRDVLGVAQEYAAAWPQPVRGKSLIFTGAPGTGKTHLCTAIIATLLERRISAMYAPMSRLVRRVRDTWNKSSTKGEIEVIDGFIAPALLVIDEFMPSTTFERELVADILNERYAQRRPYIIATNIPADELHDAIPARTLDRMREDGGLIVPFLWPSHRGKMNTQQPFVGYFNKASPSNCKK